MNIDERRERIKASNQRINEAFGEFLDASDELAKNLPEDCKPHYGQMLINVKRLVDEIEFRRKEFSETMRDLSSAGITQSIFENNNAKE